MWYASAAFVTEVHFSVSQDRHPQEPEGTFRDVDRALEAALERALAITDTLPHQYRKGTSHRHRPQDAPVVRAALLLELEHTFWCAAFHLQQFSKEMALRSCQSPPEGQLQPCAA